MVGELSETERERICNLDRSDLIAETVYFWDRKTLVMYVHDAIYADSDYTDDDMRHWLLQNI